MSRAFQPVEIVGGGLAGLSLGLALRRSGVPVTIFEAGDYPRHRVCGEFITGLRRSTEETLGLGPFLADALGHDEVTWYRGAERIARQRLPETARAISRQVLDERLARAFRAAGGDLRTRERVAPAEPRAGRVDATGRRRSGEPWLGLKIHVRNFAHDAGLEMHLGHEAYVGLCALPGGEVNVCGLFRRRFLPAGSEAGALVAYLEAAGLGGLAERVRQADLEPGTAVAVAGLGFDFAAADRPGVHLGDAGGMLPPFLGNGMAAAFQTAEEALVPLRRWSNGGADWPDTCAEIQRRIERRLRRRHRWSRWLHPFLLSPGRQRWVARMARGPELPLHLLYHATH